MHRWGRWSVERELGKGAFGKVYLATTNDPYKAGSTTAYRAALKEINISNANFENRDKLAALKSELEILRKLSHERIVQVYDDDINSASPWIAMQYLVGEELFNEVLYEGPLTEEDWLDLTEDLFEALAYTEQMNIIHRDLHFKNVMRSTRGAFLIDFGISMRVGKAENSDIIGIPYFIAPEAFSNQNEWTTKIDVFSAGSVLYFAATGFRPFWLQSDSESTDFQTIGQRVQRQQCDYSKLTQLQLNLIKQMHELDPNTRMSAAEILEQVRNLKRNYGDSHVGIQVRSAREKFISYQKSQKDKRKAKVDRYSKRVSSLQLKRDLVRDILDEITSWLSQKQRNSFIVTTQSGNCKVTFEYYNRSSDSILILQMQPAVEKTIQQNFERTGWVDLTGKGTQFEVIFDKNNPDSTAAMRIANTLIITLDLGVDAFANLLISPRVLR